MLLNLDNLDNSITMYCFAFYIDFCTIGGFWYDTVIFFFFIYSDDLIVLTAFGTAAVVATQNRYMEEQNCGEGIITIQEHLQNFENSVKNKLHSVVSV